MPRQEWSHHGQYRLKVPALVTHGDDDPRVPISTSLRLNELKPSLVTFAVFPAAGHLES